MVHFQFATKFTTKSNICKKFLIFAYQQIVKYLMIFIFKNKFRLYVINYSKPKIYLFKKLMNWNICLAPAILSSPIWFRIYYFYLSLGSQRAKYYLAWVLGDAVNNASGMGFNGYDENGNARLV